jgi:ABC-type dipeptide/oligopeptide/nickel transport system ATPase subunit
MTQAKKTSSKTPDQHEVNYYIATPIKRQLSNAKKKVITSDQDRVYVVVGREGSGKSTLAFQLAYYLDPTFSVDDIVFNARTFEKRIRESPKYKAIVFDECFNGLSSKGSLSRENKNLIRLLMECRQRNLFIFLVLPSFFLLEKYAGIFRSHALFYVYIGRKHYKRRYYKVYNYGLKKVLYIMGKGLMDYKKPYNRLSYRFYGKYPDSVDKEAYLRKKLESFKDDSAPGKEDSRQTIQRNHLLWYMCNKLDCSQAEVRRFLEEVGCGMDKGGMSHIIKDVSKKLRVGG